MGLNNFLQSFTPKDRKFFVMFEESSSNLVVAAELLKKLMNTNDLNERIKIIRQIKEVENKGDDLTHKIFNELGKTFITPFDREDIHELTSRLDDVVDNINGASQRIELFDPKVFPPEFDKLADLLVDATNEIVIAIKELRNLKQPQKIRESCIKINSIENHADEVYHNALFLLFRDEKDAIELIKKKEIVESLEKATDKAEDVSDVLKTILIKMA